MFNGQAIYGYVKYFAIRLLKTFLQDFFVPGIFFMLIWNVERIFYSVNVFTVNLFTSVNYFHSKSFYNSIRKRTEVSESKVSKAVWKFWVNSLLPVARNYVTSQCNRDFKHKYNSAVMGIRTWDQRNIWLWIQNATTELYILIGEKIQILELFIQQRQQR